MNEKTSPYSKFLERTSNAVIDTSPCGPGDAFDQNHPRSFYSLLPVEVSSRINSAQVQKVMNYSDAELDEVYKPSLMLRRLRTALWLEYDRCVNTPSRYKMVVDLNRVVAGTCSIKHFREVIVRDDLMFGYILRTPPSYLVNLTEALDVGVQRMRELLDIPLQKMRFDKEGRPLLDENGDVVYELDTKAGDLLLKAFAMIDLRTKGAIPQKLNIEGMMNRRSVNVNVNASDYKSMVDNNALEDKIMTIEDLDRKLASLSDESRRLLNDATFNQADTSVIWEHESRPKVSDE